MASVSLLHEMEPFLGISFAVTLAYLGLPRFRYREEIKEHARKSLELLHGAPGAKKVNATYGSTSWYSTALDLAQNGEHAPGDAEKPNGSKTLWELLYKFLFRNKLDRKIVGFGCTMFALLIFVTVGQKVNAWPVSETSVLFGPHLIKWWYWCSLFFALAPIAGVYFGRMTVTNACAYVDENINNMLKTMQNQVNEALDPTVGNIAAEAAKKV